MTKAERKFDALVQAVRLMRKTFHRMRGAIQAGDIGEIRTRLNKQEIIDICRWEYDWSTLRNKLTDKYGLRHVPAGPNHKPYTFTANILSEIMAGTTHLLSDEADAFVYQLIGEGKTGKPKSPKRLPGVAGSTALVVAKDFAEATEYLKSLGEYAERVKQARRVGEGIGWTGGKVLNSEPGDIWAALREDDEEDEYDYGQGDPFAREGDIEEDEDGELTEEGLQDVLAGLW